MENYRTLREEPCVSRPFRVRAIDQIEQVLVGANRELMTRFEKKIQQTIARVWGEEK